MARELRPFDLYTCIYTNARIKFKTQRMRELSRLIACSTLGHRIVDFNQKVCVVRAHDLCFNFERASSRVVCAQSRGKIDR